MTATTPAIDAHNLHKQFTGRRGWRRLARPLPFTAVADVSLTVPAGHIFGLLGPNGAGKTTLVKMLCTLIEPSGGHATVTGFPLAQAAAIKAHTGLVVADERSFYWRLTARQNLAFFAAMHNLHGAAAAQRVAALLTAVDLTTAADRRVSDFSTGMRQRLAIARALLHQPRLLFLDEPSRSLDPTAAAGLHTLIRQLRAGGVTIFLVTHNLAEAESLCDTVALMHRGVIRAVGTPASLRQTLRPQRRYTLTTAPLPAGVLAGLHQLTPITSGDSGEMSFVAAEDDGVLTAVLAHLHHHAIPIHTITAAPPTLEAVFAHYTREEPAA